jgi:hypothetical protein
VLSLVVMTRRSRRAKRPVFRCGPHGKEAFRTQDAAVRALIRYTVTATRRTERIPVRAYPGTCGFWHLTSIP